MNTHIVSSPCHNVPFWFGYTYEGPPYMQEAVVDEMSCTAAGCFNSWDINGQPF